MRRSHSRIIGPDTKGAFSMRRQINAASICAFRKIGPVDMLSITRPCTINARSACRLRALPSVRRLWLWCDVTRAAIRHLVSMPGLEVMDVLDIKGKGALSGFDRATQMHSFRSNCGLSCRDVVAIAECSTLRQLGIQNAELTPKALDALCSLPHLESLDLEGTQFDDAMARRMSESLSLKWMELGATRLTRSGLESLLLMTQLRGLDLWATQLAVEDFVLLRNLPALEYVSIGGYIDTPIDGSALMPSLLSLPALKRVWLDGVTLDSAQIALLERRFDVVHIS